jgi:uncharacterized membrane protein YccC
MDSLTEKDNFENYSSLTLVLMPVNLRGTIKDEINALFSLSPGDKLWHTPLLAAACVGIPLLLSYYLNRIGAGMLLCTGAFVILYLPPGDLKKKMVTLLLCSLGFAAAFALGLLFGFNRTASLFALSLFTFGIHFLVNYIGMRPPGSFLFIMLFSVAICIPYDPDGIAIKTTMLLAGSLFACLLTFIYYLFFLKKMKTAEVAPVEKKTATVILTDSAILALCVGLSLAFAEMAMLQKPYWIPVSCVSVMQGATIKHMWQRSFQRILGTVVGLIVAWFILMMHPPVIDICIAIIALQFLADSFIGRHYALVVVFFTPIAIFLAEAGSGMQEPANALMKARLADTFIGAAFGLAGGYCLHLQFWKKFFGKRRLQSN